MITISTGHLGRPLTSLDEPRVVRAAGEGPQQRRASAMTSLHSAGVAKRGRTNSLRPFIETLLIVRRLAEEPVA